MAIKKGAGGVEDLTLGMSTVEQIRKGKPVQITQVNAGNIPYSTTQSITQKLGNMDGAQEATRVDIDNHKADKNNPHEMTPADIGAAPTVHTHVIGDTDGLQTALNNKANKVHVHVIGDVTGLQTELNDKLDLGEAYLKTEYIIEGGTSSQAGKPIVLDNTGKLHPTISGSGLYPVAMYTPDATNEYPDTTGETFGAYWGVIGIDPATGYTFVGGDLAGSTVYPNDTIIYGSQGWGLFIAPTDSSAFYRLDGTLAISAPFAGGGQQLKNIAVATEAGDAVEFSQISSLTTSFMRLDGTSAMEAILPMGGFKITGVSGGIDSGDVVVRWQLTNVETDLATHIADVDNPHNITKAQVGLGSAQNTPDLAKPISDDTQEALDIKVNSTLSFLDVDEDFNESGIRVATSWVNSPGSTVGMLIQSDEPTTTTGRVQLFVGNDGKLFTRYGASNPIDWVEWTEYAISTVGEIKQWGGKVVDIPSGWNLADGSKGTIDMTADFKTYGTSTVVYIQFIGA